MTGQIYSFMKSRFFGFIRTEDGQEYFFHASNYNGTPRLGTIVSFELAEPTKLGQKKQCVNIQPISNPYDALAGDDSKAVR